MKNCSAAMAILTLVALAQENLAPATSREAPRNRSPYPWANSFSLSG